MRDKNRYQQTSKQPMVVTSSSDGYSVVTCHGAGRDEDREGHLNEMGISGLVCTYNIANFRGLENCLRSATVQSMLGTEHAECGGDQGQNRDAP